MLHAPAITDTPGRTRGFTRVRIAGSEEAARPGAVLAARALDSEAQMSYQLMAACWGQSIYTTDVQDQIDIQRWEDEGGAPARHPLRATSCERADRAEARQASAADNRMREALPVD